MEAWTISYTAFSACLDAFHFELTFQLLAVRQVNPHKHDPVAAHRKFDRCLVTSRPYFPGGAENGIHPRMRHVSLHIDARAGDRVTGGVRQTDGYCRWTDPWRLRRYLMPHHQARRLLLCFPAPWKEGADA